MQVSGELNDERGLGATNGCLSEPPSPVAVVNIGPPVLVLPRAARPVLQPSAQFRFAFHVEKPIENA